MAGDPRIPEDSIKAAIAGIDELEFIDQGGQGDAWRVRRNGGGDEVLKVIIGADSPRVAREIATMRAVSSPHVMRFSEAGALNHAGAEHPFIIGEYVPGRSVARRLQDGNWPNEREALQTMVRVLDGLAAIHKAEVVHRDIKPGNVALRSDSWSDPVILDLGLVRDLLGDSITVYPDLLGTIPFMSPEQLRRERAVRRSDVFSAGIMLFLLLTRQHPFFASNEHNLAIEVFEERVRDDDRPDWGAASAVADDVREVLEPMLRPDAFERPRAVAAASALRSIESGR